MITWEFRPLPDFFSGKFRRYANGLWLDDDGEYDLAFIGRSEHSPCCLYVDGECRENIVCSWPTTSWSARVAGHPGGNAWHYALRDGTTKWGNIRDDYRNSPNRRAGDAGMSKMSSECGCSNGHRVDFQLDDPYIAAGLLRNAETKEVFKWPAGMRCMYCGIEAIPPISESKQ
jgi:hypothetical protein